MGEETGRWEARFAGLYAQAQAARRDTRELIEQVRANQAKVRQQCQQIQAAAERAERIRQLWLVAGGDDRLRYSAYARLQARLVSMPVIEQAKGILMAQCGWDAEQAFDALRRASQRENIKVRELAARIVAHAVDSAHRQAGAANSAQRQAGAARTSLRPGADGAVEHGGAVVPIAARRREHTIAG